MKRIVITFIMVLIFVSALTLTAFAGSETIKVNTESSTVTVNYDTNDYSELKVVVDKGSESYNYDLFSYGEEFPLQMGDGQYTVGIYKKVNGTSYRKVTSKTFTLNSEETTVYLASVQNVNWNDQSATAKLAATLTEGLETDQEKVEAIHEYVINNIAYDYNKARTVKTGYNPEADETLTAGNGICYDFASVTASMLRSVEIPTKLVKGKSNVTRAYHAWNEVLVDGAWIVVDTSTDSINMSRGIELAFEKASNDYFAEKVY